MKTIEEFIREIEGSEALQNELTAIKDKDALVDFLKKYECGATADEFEEFVKSRTEGEITDSDAENAAGGILGVPLGSILKLPSRGYFH